VSLRNLAIRCLPPRLRHAFYYPPGHFHSPLVDPADTADDGVDYWREIDLSHDAQAATYAAIHAMDIPVWPRDPTPGRRYYSGDRSMFSRGDATVLAGMIGLHRPKRIVEVGSGFSTAAMLDTMDHIGHRAAITCIEPYPDRLKRLVRADDPVTLYEMCVQQMPPEKLFTLYANDILFIDSSHVAKVGSDVAFLLLRILPKLKPGVLVQVHDIFYPHSYPSDWLDKGWSWNESLMLRALLVGGGWRVEAFNSYAATHIAEFFPEPPHSVGSIWLRKL
jgi:predicted O-methyltransferase YrrM